MTGPDDEPVKQTSENQVPVSKKWALKSQAGQDQYLFKKFFWNKKQAGIFVEFGIFISFRLNSGARNGIEHSNTYFYENALGWKGLLIEAIPNEFATLAQNRPNSLTLNAAICPKRSVAQFLVSKFGGWHGLKDQYPEFRKDSETETIKVQCYTLNEVLGASGFRHIDYMSVDTEGSEVDLLEAFDFEKFVVDILVVEVLTAEIEKKIRLEALMASKGYTKIIDYVVAEDTWDVMFKRTQEADLSNFKKIKATGFSL